MLMDYHQMNMNAHGPSVQAQKRQQFWVVLSIGIGFLAYSTMTCGLLLPIEPTQGVFPGGNFVYKFTARDYAASPGLGRRIARDWLSAATGTKSKVKHPPPEVEEILYHIYLDDPTRMGGARQRWMTGILVGDDQKDIVEKVLATNESSKPKKRQPTQEEMNDLAAREIFELLPYEYVDLPSVDSLVLQFPHTHGFVSQLFHSYRIIPALRRLAIENGESGNVPVIISTCSQDQQMCTHYAPLVQGKDFLVGRPDTEFLLQALPEERFLDWEGFKEGGRKVLPFAKGFFDMLP